MERLKAEESRLREQQQYGDWQKKEEHFHLKQATQRSKVGHKNSAPCCTVEARTEELLFCATLDFLIASIITATTHRF